MRLHQSFTVFYALTGVTMIVMYPPAWPLWVTVSVFFLALNTLLTPGMSNPDFNIGPDYLLRWHMIPRNRFLNIYLHCILKDDDDRALHDHPWYTLSWCMRGELLEYAHDMRIIRPSIIPRYRSATFAHRLTVRSGPVWTLFITGPKVREWGFHCPKGWRHWKQFTDTRDSGKVGRGCGE